MNELICLAMNQLHEFSPVYTIFRKFWVFSQKSPGRHECAAKRHIRFDPVSGFYYEPPGDNKLPPSGAMLFCTIFVVLWCMSHYDFWNMLVYTVFDD